MRVQAIAKGNYNGLRKVGEIFALVDRENEDGEVLKAEDQFSKKWMVELDSDGNPVKGTPTVKAAMAKQADKPVKNLAEKSTPSKGDNGTDIEALKGRLEDADKAEDEGLDDGKADDSAEAGAATAAPATRRTRKTVDVAAEKAEAKEDVKDAGEAAKAEAADADDKGDDNGSADDADADKAPAEEGTRRRRRRG